MPEKEIKILIIDDVSDNIQILARFLKKVGYQICFALNGEKGIQLVKENTIDLILCDIMMPEMDGFEVCKKLKESNEYKDIPIIFVTGKSEIDSIVEGFAVGAVDYISKPFQKQEIIARVKTHLELKFAREYLQKSYEELSRITEACQLFVPERFLNQILSNDSKEKFKPKRFQSEKFTILFTDVRAYTKKAEQMKLQQIFDFLNKLFGMMEPVISNNHGFVDKFIGDAIMACFDKEESAEHAVMAAIKIQEELNEFNKCYPGEEIKIGIGIDTGEVMVGTMGSNERLNPTVIGDHVNMASRLEALNKHYNTKLLISHCTYSELTPHKFQIREIDTVCVEGKSEAVIIYEVLDLDSEHNQNKKIYTREKLFEGIKLYKNKSFEEAWLCFKECLEYFPEDVVPQKYLKRCRFFQKHPPKEDDFQWDGIIDKREFLLDQELHMRTPRIPVDFDINLFFNNISTQSKVKDISVGGAKIICDRVFDYSAIVSIEIQLPTLDHNKHYSIKMMSRIAWKDYDNESHQYKFGLEFLTLTLDEEKILLNFIEKSENALNHK